MSPASNPAATRALALPHPRIALDALAHLPHAFLLHSGLAEPRGRWSFFGADPFATFGPERYGDAIGLWRRERYALECPAPESESPFTGGLVGCWSYDFGRRFEAIPSVARDDTRWPDVWLAAYDVVGAFDHAADRAWLYSSGCPAAQEDRARRASERLDFFTRLIESHAGPALAALPGTAAAPAMSGREATPGTLSEISAHSTFAADAYRAAVERVREHIRCGDIFQANLSQRWTVPRRDAAVRAGGEGLEIFRALADHSPAPFAAWVDLGERAVASASPERFLGVRGKRVETRPIKGTRPRGADPAADAVQRAALLASAKDRAENVMIVDVLRNDLGRVCETGSISVPELCALESFAQVHHLTSTVTGTLRADRDAVDLLHACFPGGSITGAPKIRAMQIIEALEPVRRALYSGAIGYLDWSGDADWSVSIRTALVTRDAVHFAAGGGITVDSDPDAEYRETLAKAEGWRLAMAGCGRLIRLGERRDSGAGGLPRSADGVARVPDLRS